MRLNEGDTVASLALIDTSLEGEAEEVEEVDDGTPEMAAAKPKADSKESSEEK
jgi:hypothetical protein